MAYKLIVNTWEAPCSNHGLNLSVGHVGRNHAFDLFKSIEAVRLPEVQPHGKGREPQGVCRRHLAVLKEQLRTCLVHSAAGSAQCGADLEEAARLLQSAEAALTEVSKASKTAGKRLAAAVDRAVLAYDCMRSELPGGA